MLILSLSTGMHILYAASIDDDDDDDDDDDKFIPCFAFKLPTYFDMVEI